MISAEMTVARLLDEHPELLPVLTRYHAHFAQLRDQGFHQLMAARETLSDAARIAGMPVDDLLAALRNAAADEAPQAAAGPPATTTFETGASESRPHLPPSLEVHLDVRDDIRRGQEPLARIMAMVKQLTPSQVLVLRAPFEPAPLYAVLGRKGYTHWTERRSADDWCVWFRRAGVGGGSGEAPVPMSGPLTDRPFVIDVRGLEPPEPMVRILEAVERLKAGETLEVLHERRPLFLYPQLDERGFVHETDEPEAGVIRIVIRHGGERV